jgi:methyl-accepting chemotaxis protein
MRMISDLRLVWKILVAPAFAIIVMTIVAALLVNGGREAERTRNEIEWQIVVPVQQAKDLKDLLTLAHARVLAMLSLAANDTATSGRAATIAAIGDSLARVQEAGKAGSWQARLPGAQAKAVDLALAAYVAAARSVLESVQVDVAYAVMMLGDTNGQFETVRGLLDQASDTLQTLRQARVDESRRQLAGALLLNAAIGVGAVLAAIVLAIVTGRLISRPVVLLTAVMGRLAERDVAITIPHTGRGDEIGSMARAVEVFRAGMIVADRAAMERNAERDARERHAALLETRVHEFEARIQATVAQLAAAASGLETTARTMSSTAAHTGDQAAQVAAAAEAANQGVQSVVASTEELTVSIGEISRQVDGSARIAARASAEVASAGTAVRALANEAHQINDVVEMISSIANRTNLLALNASIEAARAGEAGRGFAVVASEVKNLAAQASRATEQIAARISQMQQGASRVVSTIGEIGRVVGEVDQIAAAISAAIEQQGAAAAEIAGHVQEASRATQDVTANIAGVSEAAGRTGTACGGLLEAASGLTRQARQLSAEVDSFIADVRAA